MAAERLLRIRNTPVYAIVCFHSQQSAEKYLKALLQEHRQPIPKIHHLIELLALVTQVEPTCQFLHSDLEILEDYAVDFRYPGILATKDDAKSAYKAVKTIRAFIRQRLNL